MEQEIWKDISGYEGLYQVSNLGRVKSLERTDRTNHFHKEIILTQCFDVYNYKVVMLCKDGKQKQYKVHRLVAMAFIDNPRCLPMVGHKDESRDNNNVENLEWTTAKDNNNMPKSLIRKSISHSGLNLYGKNNHAKMVVCGNVVYDSIKRFSEEINENSQVVSKWLRGKIEMPNEFKNLGLRYYEENVQ